MVRNGQIVVIVTPRTISAWTLVTLGSRDGNTGLRFLLPSCMINSAHLMSLAV